MNKEFETAMILSEDLLGEPAVPGNSLEALLGRLREGARGIIADIPWGEKRGDDDFERLQIVLMELRGDRLIYINPLPRFAGAAGNVGGGSGNGPLRTLEADGFESMSLSVFEKLFKAGGKALL